MICQALEQLPRSHGNLRDALHVIDDADGYRDLHVSIVIVIFVASAALSVCSSFYIIEFLIWLGLGRIDPTIPVFLSYISLFVVWLLVFLAALSILDALKIRNIEAMTHAGLSRLTLSRRELQRLGDAIARGRWRHRRALLSAISRLNFN